MNQKNNAAGGMGLMGTLTLIFVVLKLTGLIHWSWLWVLAPVWMPSAILLIVLLWVVWKSK